MLRSSSMTCTALAGACVTSWKPMALSQRMSSVHTLDAIPVPAASMAGTDPVNQPEVRLMSDRPHAAAAWPRRPGIHAAMSAAESCRLSRPASGWLTGISLPGLVRMNEVTRPDSHVPTPHPPHWEQAASAHCGGRPASSPRR